MLSWTSLASCSFKLSFVRTNFINYFLKNKSSFANYKTNKIFLNNLSWTRTVQPISSYRQDSHKCATLHLNSLSSNAIDFTKVINNTILTIQSDQSTMAENRFIVGYAKLGTSGCKKCKQKIAKGSLRIGKVVANPFSDEGDMKQWHHTACIFETFKRARATTRIINETDDLEGFGDLTDADKKDVNQLIDDFFASTPSKKKGASTSKSPSTPKVSKVQPKKEAVGTDAASPSHSTTAKPPPTPPSHAPSGSSGGHQGGGDGERDNSFREFRRLCAEVAEESSYNSKTQLVTQYLKNGSTGDGFKGDTFLLLKLLLPGVVKLVYNLNSKQLVKLFSQIFNTNLDEMVEDLNQGDVAETIRAFFDQSTALPPQKKCTLSIQQVDSYLEELSTLSKEEEQQHLLRKIAKRCTGNDLKMVVRLIKHDLRINAGAKHILDALDSNAYAAFQASRNLRDVVDRVLRNRADDSKSGMNKQLSVEARLMTPVLPMLADACRSVEQAMKKCPNGFYAEIKYDGERVQLHKRGDDFSFYSRSLKPVLSHKVQHFKEFIPKAFPSGDDLILDSEVLLIDTNTSKPLPFGTLGVHKKAAFHDANVCLFIFDCLHINGQNLMNKPLRERRDVLHKYMKEIPNRVLFSEMKRIKQADDLQELMTKVFREGLEGLVLKDVNGVYEPGKRHWLKVKKDYLMQGSMADSADLVVLGAYYGTGNKGGMMSVFLMGVYDPHTHKWCTVTKVSGIDDQTLDKLQTDLDMVKISKDPSKIPKWLNIKKGVFPDFVVADPEKSPVWEIAGAEFSKAEIHTADGISIRFPRVMKFRDDKNWKTATDLMRLKDLFKKSKETSDFPNLGKNKKTPKKENGDNDNGSDFNSSNNRNENGENDGSSKGGNKSPVRSLFKTSASPMKAEAYSPSKAASSSPVKAGQKRKAEDNEENISPKKRKPMCKYGASCYQSGSDHKQTYDHPSPPSSPHKCLPNVFSGVKMHLPESTHKYKELRRYIIAFDGDVLMDFDLGNATHIISEKGKMPAGHGSGVCVSPTWLWDCIKKRKLLPVASYQP